jgi:hypothetical protein
MDKTFDDNNLSNLNLIDAESIKKFILIKIKNQDQD